jgi:DNA-binding transcriptional LysR family regulator
MSGFDLDHLQAFEHVVETGSFSAAAERLNLSQPAVSLRIRQLERRVGTRLVERCGRRVQPTAAGRALIPHVRAIAEAVAGAAAAVAPHADEVRGRVRLGTGATACIYLLPPVLRELRRRFPLLDIVVATGNTHDILRGLEENNIDVALVTLPAGSRAVATTALVEDEIVAIFPPGTTAPHAATAAALAALPVVLYEAGGHTRRLIDDWFRRTGARLRPAMELGNIEAIKELAGAGLGCGLVPRLSTSGGRLPPGVVERSLAPPLYRRLGMALRRDKVPDRGLREVVAALRTLGGGAYYHEPELRA